MRNMAMAEAADTLVLRCELGWEDVREIMAARRLLTRRPRSRLSAAGMFAALLWTALAGACETGRLFLLLDQDGRNVRGFIPKAGRDGPQPDAELGSLIRERISAGIS